jgi:hypothetical protein
MAAISDPDRRLRLNAWWLLLRKFVENVWRMLREPDIRPILWFVFLIICLIIPLALYWQFWNDLDATTYFYTFSTISQTLAGAFGFLVAVALYRIGSMEGEMGAALAEVIPYAATADNQGFLQMKNRSRDWDDIEKYIDQKQIDAHPSDEVKSVVSTNWNYFKMGKETLSNLKIELVGTLRLTSIVIACCLVLMPVCQLLTTDQGKTFRGPFVAMVLLIVVIILACRCLWRYWDIAKHLTDRKPRHFYMSVASGMFITGSAGSVLRRSGDASPQSDETC